MTLSAHLWLVCRNDSWRHGVRSHNTQINLSSAKHLHLHAHTTFDVLVGKCRIAKCHIPAILLKDQGQYQHRQFALAMKPVPLLHEWQVSQGSVLHTERQRTMMRTRLARLLRVLFSPKAFTRVVMFFLGSGLLMARIAGLCGFRRYLLISCGQHVLAAQYSLLNQSLYAVVTGIHCLHTLTILHVYGIMPSM